MDILVSRTLYMSCQAGPGIEPGPSALKASALPIELTWHGDMDMGSVGHLSVLWLRWCRWGVGRGLGLGSGAVG